MGGLWVLLSTRSRLFTAILLDLFPFYLLLVDLPADSAGVRSPVHPESQQIGFTIGLFIPRSGADNVWYGLERGRAPEPTSFGESCKVMQV